MRREGQGVNEIKMNSLLIKRAPFDRGVRCGNDKCQASIFIMPETSPKTTLSCTWKNGKIGNEFTWNVPIEHMHVAVALWHELHAVWLVSSCHLFIYFAFGVIRVFVESHHPSCGINATFVSDKFQYISDTLIHFGALRAYYSFFCAEKKREQYGTKPNETIKKKR